MTCKMYKDFAITYLMIYESHVINNFLIYLQMVIQYAVWDKVKEVQNMLVFQVTNLAQLLIHLFIQKGLPLSVLKVCRMFIFRSFNSIQ